MQPIVVMGEAPLFPRLGATPHPCLPPQGGKENASNLAEAGHQGRASLCALFEMAAEFVPHGGEHLVLKVRFAA